MAAKNQGQRSGRKAGAGQGGNDAAAEAAGNPLLPNNVGAERDLLLIIQTDVEALADLLALQAFRADDFIDPARQDFWRCVEWVMAQDEGYDSQLVYDEWQRRVPPDRYAPGTFADLTRLAPAMGTAGQPIHAHAPRGLARLIVEKAMERASLIAFSRIAAEDFPSPVERQRAQAEAQSTIEADYTSRIARLAGKCKDEPQAEPLAATWPKPPELEAYYGLAGEIVNTIDPYTEADKVAVLSQLLTAFGNLIGRCAHFVAEADRHYTNTYAVPTGLTSKGRKGSSWGHVHWLAEQVDPEWTKTCIQPGGLSSGEGIIHALRDSIVKTEAIREKGRATGDFEEVVVDPGVEEKRLLVHEAEFGSFLLVATRAGNNVSGVIRSAWDTGTLGNLTKNNPERATGAHLSIVGHVTAEELRRNLTTTEAANGFANRFLWLCVRRSKKLPDGSPLADDGAPLVHQALKPLVERLKEAVKFARKVGLMTRDPDARAVWHAVYEPLSEGQPGLLGAVLARAEAQVMRLACLYALLDCSSIVRRPHLLAALALWEYVERSARFIFGDALGDPMADEILQALRKAPNGLTRTEIRDLFSGHGGDKIAPALRLLVQHRLAQMTSEPTDGRPIERWRAQGAFVANVAFVAGDYLTLARLVPFTRKEEVGRWTC